MKSSRRDFLKHLLATPLALTLDVEKMLWVPGEKTIFVMPPDYTVLTWDMLSYEAFYGGCAGGGKTMIMNRYIENVYTDFAKYDGYLKGRIDNSK